MIPWTNYIWATLVWWGVRFVKGVLPSGSPNVWDWLALRPLNSPLFILPDPCLIFPDPFPWLDPELIPDEEKEDEDDDDNPDCDDFPVDVEWLPVVPSMRPGEEPSLGGGAIGGGSGSSLAISLSKAASCCAIAPSRKDRSGARASWIIDSTRTRSLALRAANRSRWQNKKGERKH